MQTILISSTFDFASMVGKIFTIHKKMNFSGSVCGVMVFVVANEHGDTSSNHGQDWLYFT